MTYLVYYDPKNDNIWTRYKFSPVAQNREYYTNDDWCLISILWDEYCEKNFVLIGEL